MDESGFESINIIPLVDVMLVLLTIVLMTSTFIAVGAIPVELPKAESSTSAALQTTTVEIDRQVAYGRASASRRLQRILEIAERV